MNWNQQLEKLERQKEWDLAIHLMQDVIEKNHHDMQAYINMNYLLMNLLVEENYDQNKSDYYEMLAKKYFNESYAQFCNNAQYLYYTGITAYMSEWFFGIDRVDADNMLAKAQMLDPTNPIYQFDYYWSLFQKNHHDKQAYMYAKIALEENSFVKTQLSTEGAIGNYLLNTLLYRCKQILGLEPYLP